MSKSILITGGAGFIGSHLADRLVGSGDYVCVIDNFNDFYDPRQKKINVAPLLGRSNFSLIDSDIRNSEIVNDVFKKGEFETVIHLAALPGVHPSIRYPRQYFDVNVCGTVSILEACKNYGVPKFIFASSSSVYGDSKRLPFKESDASLYQVSPYAVSKRACELTAFTYHHLYGIKVACLRLFTVYGPRQRPDMAIHSFIHRILNKREINLFYSGHSTRDYTYIDDIIEGIMLAKETEVDYEVINLGSASSTALIELAHKIEHILSSQAKLILKEEHPGDMRHTLADITKACELLHYKPRISIDEGLQQTVSWFVNKRQDITCPNTGDG